MSNEHAPRVWLCTVKAHSSLKFFDAHSFRQHMLSNHRDTFGDSQLEVLIRINSKPLAKPFSLCPLCGGFPDDCPTVEEQDMDGKPDQLPRHIAGHLKELALLSLPPRDDVGHTNKVTATGEETPIESANPSSPSLTFTETRPQVTDLEFSQEENRYIYRSISEVNRNAENVSDSDILMDNAWLDFSLYTSRPSREDEWGLYPAYGGHLQDPILEKFVDRFYSHNLWALVVAKLSDEDRKNINFSYPDKLNILSDVLELTTQSRQECINKRWRYTRKSGETVIFIDLFGKIIKWIDLFKQVGDAAIEYDPVCAALPWAGVRFLLQVCSIKVAKRHC